MNLAPATHAERILAFMVLAWAVFGGSAFAVSDNVGALQGASFFTVYGLLLLAGDLFAPTAGAAHV